MSYFNPGDAGLPNQSIPRSSHDLGYIRRFTTNFGRLVPVNVLPVCPTENYEFQHEFILRTVPFIGQVFQRYFVSLDTFYVPNRILWKNFDLFLAGGYDGSTEYIHPYFDLAKFLDSNNPGFYSNFQYLNSLLDYMDISPYQEPIVGENSLIEDRKSLLPFAAYAKIALDHYTNQFLDNADVIQGYLKERSLITDDGEMNTDFISLMNRLHLRNSQNVENTTFSPIVRPYDFDYFTSARPETQHGPVMTIPLELVNTDIAGNQTFRLVSNSGSTSTDPVSVRRTNGSKQVSIFPQGINSNPLVVNASVFENVATIESLREAERVLEFFESIGLVGWKPEDFNLSQFNTRTKDERLMISDRVHHETFSINIGEVFSNNASAIQTQGQQHDVPGVATSTAKGYGISQKYNYRVPEYGYFITLASVYPEPAYSQGCPKHFDLLDRYSYPNPKFANLGLEPIFNSELYHTGQAGDKFPFGYTTRYADRKSSLNRINSEFRDSFKYMCSSRLFNQQSSLLYGRPRLNEAFNKIQVNYNDLDRVFNVEFPLLENGPIIVDMKHSIDCNIPFPKFGTPRI